MLCCRWAYGCTLTLVYLWLVGAKFWKNVGWLSPSDIVVSWMRLQTTTDCILQLYCMYSMHFNTFICCGWAHGALLHCYTCTCTGGGQILENVVWLSPSDVVLSWMRLQTTTDHIPQSYWMLAKCFSTFTLCGWAYGCIGAPINWYTCAGGGQILENVVWLHPSDVVLSW
jgi:hypothetical protein